MARQYKCISGDGHIDLNPDIWRDRVQAKYRERAPKRVKMPNGSDAVVIDGGKPNTIGITRSVRVAHTDLAKQVPTFETCAGTGTPQQRLAEQDQDGIDLRDSFFTDHFRFAADQRRRFLPRLHPRLQRVSRRRIHGAGTGPFGLHGHYADHRCRRRDQGNGTLRQARHERRQARSLSERQELSDARRRQVLGGRARPAHGAHQP